MTSENDLCEQTGGLLSIDIGEKEPSKQTLGWSSRLVLSLVASFAIMGLGVAVVLAGGFRDWRDTSIPRSMISTSKCSAVVTHGEDCIGDDIRMERWVYSIDICCAACARTDGCGAFVFVTGGRYPNRCYLKSSCSPKSGCGDGYCAAGVLAPTLSPSTPSPTPIHVSNVSKKRGVGFNSKGTLLPDGEPYACDDALKLNLADSWYYTWNANPDIAGVCTSPRAAEFVPMIHNAWKKGKLQDKLPANYKSLYQASGVRFLLGFNEPDLKSSWIDPADAARLWPQLQDLADEFEPPLELVAPAMTFLGEKGFSWLEQFFERCNETDGCEPNRIKYLNYHDYRANINNIRNSLDESYRRFGRKAWLTEFAVGDFRSGHQVQDRFMKKALPVLETMDSVYRYAWFAARNPWHNFCRDSSLFVGGRKELTSTGEIYAHFQAESSST